MTIRRMDHVGIVVDDLAAAKDFFLELGLELVVDGAVKGEWVDRIVGLDGVETDFAMLATPDGNSRIELVTFRSPAGAVADRLAPANVPGLRHLCLNVDDIEAVLDRLRPLGAELVREVVRYEGSYLLCYVRGPEGIILELAEDLAEPPPAILPLARRQLPRPAASLVLPVEAVRVAGANDEGRRLTGRALVQALQPYDGWGAAVQIGLPST